VWPLAAARCSPAFTRWPGCRASRAGVIFVDRPSRRSPRSVPPLRSSRAIHRRGPARPGTRSPSPRPAPRCSHLRDRPALARAAIPAEAVIGIVYAVAAALTVLTLERVPLGGEQVKALLVGSLLGVTRDEYFHPRALRGARHRRLAAAAPLPRSRFGGPVRHARLWDFGFYLVLARVTSSRARGRRAARLAYWSCRGGGRGAGVPPVGGWRLDGRRALGSVVGIAASFRWDLPTGARWWRRSARSSPPFGAGSAAPARARWPPRGARLGGGARSAVALAGAALAVVPQPTRVARLAGGDRAAAQDVFPFPHERAVADEARRAIARAPATSARCERRQADHRVGPRVATRGARAAAGSSRSAVRSSWPANAWCTLAARASRERRVSASACRLVVVGAAAGRCRDAGRRRGDYVRSYV